jgi:hypothetical protein
LKSICFFVIILVLGCSAGDFPSSQQAEKEPYVVYCQEPIPVFTLGRDSDPRMEQGRSLCECIWKNLGSWEREVSEKISQGRVSEVSKLHIRAFNSAKFCGKGESKL